MDGREHRSQALDAAELREATLNLVDAAQTGGAATVLRTLVRDIVGTGYAEGASIWAQAAPGDAWSRPIHFGEPTSAPPTHPNVQQPSSTDAWPVAMATGVRLMVARETVDVDGHREDREDAVEALAHVASSLLDDDALQQLASEPPGPLPFGGPDRDLRDAG